MCKINWRRVFLCGLMVGILWGLLGELKFTLLGRDLLTAMRGSHGRPTINAWLVAFWVCMELVLGVWIMWLYAAIRPRYGAGLKTAVGAGVALWVITAWVDVVWASVAGVSFNVLMAPVAADLPIDIVAAVVGAWLYRE